MERGPPRHAWGSQANLNQAQPLGPIVAATFLVVANEAGEILLIWRTDNGNRAVPGGVIEFREPPASGDVV